MKKILILCSIAQLFVTPLVHAEVISMDGDWTAPIIITDIAAKSTGRIPMQFGNDTFDISCATVKDRATILGESDGAYSKDMLSVALAAFSMNIPVSLEIKQCFNGEGTGEVTPQVTGIKLSR